MPRRGQTDEMEQEQDEQPGGYLGDYNPDEGEQPGDSEQPGDGEQPGEQTPADARAAEKAAAIADIQGVFIVPEDLAKATVPVRKRNDFQLAMDQVAQDAYDRWIEKGRPTVWARMPVVTYFLDPEDVAERRKLIRKTTAAVRPEEGVSGVRIRFGKEAFTLTEEMAARIGRPDDAGKTVLSWAVQNKRSNTQANGADAEGDGDEGDEQGEN